MDDSRWLRFMTIGLVLAALAVGYFLLTGRLASNSATKTGSKATTPPAVLGQDVSPAPGSTPSASPASASDRQIASSAYNKIVERNQNKVQTLPKTGFPLGLAAVLSISIMMSGWGLRRFPK